MKLSERIMKKLAIYRKYYSPEHREVQKEDDILLVQEIRVLERALELACEDYHDVTTRITPGLPDCTSCEPKIKLLVENFIKHARKELEQ